jgi:hypothetical protein
VKLNMLTSLKKDDSLDVVGIIKESGAIQEFQPRYKPEKMIRRTIVIYDDTLNEVEVSV